MCDCSNNHQDLISCSGGKMRVTPPNTVHTTRARPSLFPVDNQKTAVADKSEVKGPVMRNKPDTTTMKSLITDDVTPTNRNSSKRVENRRCDFANIKSMFLEREKNVGGDGGKDDSRRKSSNDVATLKAAFEKNKSNNRCSTPTFQRPTEPAENNGTLKSASSNIDGQRNSYGGRSVISRHNFLRSTSQEKEDICVSAFRRSKNDVETLKSAFQEPLKKPDETDRNNVTSNQAENDDDKDVNNIVPDDCSDCSTSDCTLKMESSSETEKEESVRKADEDILKKSCDEKRKSGMIQERYSNGADLERRSSSLGYADHYNLLKPSVEEKRRSFKIQSEIVYSSSSEEELSENTEKIKVKTTLEEKRKSLNVNNDNPDSDYANLDDLKDIKFSYEEIEQACGNANTDMKLSQKEEVKSDKVGHKDQRERNKERNFKQERLQKQMMTNTFKKQDGKEKQEKVEEKEENYEAFHEDSYSDYANLHDMIGMKSTKQKIEAPDTQVEDNDESYGDYANLDNVVNSRSSIMINDENSRKIDEDDSLSDYANLDSLMKLRFSLGNEDKEKENEDSSSEESSSEDESKARSVGNEDCRKCDLEDSDGDYANLDDLNLTPTVNDNEVFTFEHNDLNSDYANLDDLIHLRSEMNVNNCEECEDNCSDYANLDDLMNLDPKQGEICKFAASAMDCDFENLDDANLTPTYQSKGDVFSFAQEDIDYANLDNVANLRPKFGKREALSEYYERNSTEFPKYPDRHSAEFYSYPDRNSAYYGKYAECSPEFAKYVARNSAEFSDYVARNSIELSKYAKRRNSADADRNSTSDFTVDPNAAGDISNLDVMIWRQPSLREHLLSSASTNVSSDADIYQTLSLAPEFFRKQRQNILSRRRGAKDDAQRPSSTILPSQEPEVPPPTQECRRVATLSKRSRSVVRDSRHGYALMKRRSLPVTSTEKEMSEIEEEKSGHSDIDKEPDIQVSRFPHKCNCSLDDSQFLSRQRVALMSKRDRRGSADRRGSREQTPDREHAMEESWRKQSPSPSNRSSQTMSSDLSECGISEFGSETFEGDSGYTSDILQSSLSSINSNENTTDNYRYDVCRHEESPTPPPVPDHGCRHHHNKEDDAEKRLSLDSSLKSLGIQPETTNEKKHRGMSFGIQLGKRLARKIKSPTNHDTVHGIQYAVTNGDYDMLSKLLAAPDAAHYINFLHPPGVAVLHQACVLGNFNIVKLLVQKGADVRLKTWRNLSPTKLAATCGHFDIAQLLLLTGADVRDVMYGI